MVLNIKVSFFLKTNFLIKSKLDLSTLLALCCSRLLIVTLYFIAFYIDIFIVFLLIATKDSLFSLVFIKKNGKMYLLCLNCSDNDLCF